MIASQTRPTPDPVRRPAPASGVTISPSHPQLRRADPSLSFQVTAPGARGFDVIVATDPALFDPANAHRRTPKNFRSSRQDFQGEPIEIETGFYMLPRAFVRDVISVEPRPSRLYYLAVAYSDQAAQDGRYSIPSNQMGATAPYVTLSSDLNAASLAKVLGVAVERLGAVNAAGRVMSVMPAAGAGHLPEAIGGLPLVPRQVRAPVWDGAPAPAPIGNGLPPQNGEPAPNGQPPVATAPRPAPAAEPVPNVGSAEFVDEDYAYGAPDPAVAEGGFRDLDTAAYSASSMAYDDGYGPMDAAAATGAPQPAPIPPLDAAPDSAPNAAPANGGPGNGAPEPISAPVAGGPAAAAPAPAAQGLDALVQMVIAEGAGGRYEALNLDGAFRGRMGQTSPYYQRAHEGLRFGPHQASQDSGELGELLTLMQAADPATFGQVFGPSAAQLIETATQAGPSSIEVQGGRSARVQPVDGRDLWEEPWVERFRAAAQHPPFQSAMRAQIIARRLEPMLPVAEALGLDGPRGPAMLLAMAIHMGVDRAVAAIRAAINPFDTPARLAAALDALGHTEIGTFRQANGLPSGDQVDAPTHLALFAALRGLGADSPLQIPDDDAVMDMLVTGVGPGATGDALLRLRVSETIQPGTAAGAQA